MISYVIFQIFLFTGKRTRSKLRDQLPVGLVTHLVATVHAELAIFSFAILPMHTFYLCK